MARVDFLPKNVLDRGTNFVGKSNRGGGGLIYVGELMNRSYQGEMSFAK